jgi:hypothetical protein
MSSDLNVVQVKPTKENLLDRHLEGGQDGSVMCVAKETTYGYMGGWRMKYFTYEPGWYWNTWEEAGGPVESKEAAIEAVKESIKNWEEYCERGLRRWMNSYDGGPL